eukprot:14413132-Ditylum_brightwellii.AAC.1
MDTDGGADASDDVMSWCCGALWMCNYHGSEEHMNKVLIPSWLDGVAIMLGMVPYRNKWSNAA